ELDTGAAVRLHRRRPGDERLGIDQAPIAETRLRLVGGDLLDERLLVERQKETGALEIGRDDLRHIAAELNLVGRIAGEVRDGDGQRLDLGFVDIDMDLGAGGRRDQRDDRQNEDKGIETPKEQISTAHEKSLGSKVIVKVCHCSYFCGGNLSGWQRGLRRARWALSAADWKTGSP